MATRRQRSWARCGYDSRSPQQKLWPQWICLIHETERCRGCIKRIRWIRLGRVYPSRRMEQSCSNRRQADVWSVDASCPFCQPLSFSLNDALVAQRSCSPSPAPERRRSRSRSRSRSRDRDRERRRIKRSRSRSYSPRRGSRYSRSPKRSYNRYKERSRSPRGRHSPRGHATDDEEITDTYIRTVVAEVKGHGQKYEESLREMEKDNPRYSFLTDRRVSSSHTPYWHILADCQTGSTESTDFINHY